MSTAAPSSPSPAVVAAAARRRFVPKAFDPAKWDQVEPLYRALLERVIGSPAELERWLLELSELDAAVDEAMTRAHNDHCCHTDDAAIEAAYMHYVKEIQPRLKPLVFELQRKFALSPHRAALSDARLGLLGKRWQADIDLFRQENVPLQTQVTEISTEYGKVTGAMIVTFRGKSYTLQQLARFLEETDRPTRQEAWEVATARRLEDRGTIDALFDKLLDLRGRIALNADLPDYRAYIWRSMKRFDYTPGQCHQFADAIAELCVPLVSKLDKRRREQMGLDRLRPWDLSVDPRGRSPLRPFGPDAIDDFVARTTRVFHRVSPELGAQFASLRTGENLDLQSRKGKRPGGYQSSLEETRQPFIFMNAAGLHADVDTLLHEGGHAFHFLAACSEPVLELRSAPLEFCEVASMAMELFGADHLDEFYTAPEAARARKQHLEGIIRFFPWMATIDSFQHWLYAGQPRSTSEREPQQRHADRRRQWLAILDRFTSREVDWSGHADARAALWQRQLHLFNYPFYYIEYGIAQLGALQLWVRYRKDPRGALADYRKALALGGTRPLPELFAAAGIRFDFSAATLAPLIAAIQEELAALDALDA